jgi:hypothetical protein
VQSLTLFLMQDELLIESKSLSKRNCFSHVPSSDIFLSRVRNASTSRFANWIDCIAADDFV